MSIVALKNKARAMYDSHSRGTDGFSLNGKARFTSGVGQNLGKSVTRTPFKGAEPAGHGGGKRCRVGGIHARENHCNGSPYLRFVANSGTCLTRQVLVKHSVMNTSGMIQERFMGILHGTYPKTWVQPPLLSNSSYQEKHAAEEVRCATTTKTTELVWPPCGPYAKPVKPETTEEHLKKLTAQCKNPSCEQVPFPIPFSRVSGCNSFYLTWQEAQKAGLLCATYKG